MKSSVSRQIVDGSLGNIKELEFYFEWNEEFFQNEKWSCKDTHILKMILNKEKMVYTKKA